MVNQLHSPSRLLWGRSPPYCWCAEKSPCLFRTQIALLWSCQPATWHLSRATSIHSSNSHPIL